MKSRVLTTTPATQKAIGHTVAPADVASGQAHGRTIAQPSCGGGRRRLSRRDPDVLSKAVFYWWFPNRARFEPAAAAVVRARPASCGGPPRRERCVHESSLGLSRGSDSPRSWPLPAVRRLGSPAAGPGPRANPGPAAIPAQEETAKEVASAAQVPRNAAYLACLCAQWVTKVNRSRGCRGPCRRPGRREGPARPSRSSRSSAPR